MSGSEGKAGDRAERLAAALRANLRRRKAAATSEDPAPEATASPRDEA